MRILCFFGSFKGNYRTPNCSHAKMRFVLSTYESCRLSHNTAHWCLIFHFFFYCSKVSTFWNELNILLKSKKLISKNFHIQDILFGLFSADNVDDNILVNYIILESKYLIFGSKLSQTFPTIALLISKCKTTHQIERFIARKNNKLHFHNKKWHQFLPIMEHELSPPTPNLN